MGRLVLMDKETGEIIEENVVFIGRKPYKVDKGFVKVFVSFLKDLVEDEEIAGKAIRLLFYMVEECLDFNTFIVKIIPKKAQERLKISKQTYYNWINTLIQKGIIQKVDTYTYILSANTFVKGNQKKAFKDLDDKMDFDF